MTKLRASLFLQLCQGRRQRRGHQGMSMLEMLVGLMLLTIFTASLVLVSQITLRYSMGPVDTNADASKVRRYVAKSCHFHTLILATVN